MTQYIRTIRINLTGAREDAFRNPMKLYGRLLALANDVGTSSSDFKPTDQQREVGDLLNQRLVTQSAAYQKVLTGELKALNKLLQNRYLLRQI